MRNSTKCAQKNNKKKNNKIKMKASGSKVGERERERGVDLQIP